VLDTKQKEEMVRVLLSKDGPLYRYLMPGGEGDTTFRRLKELINEMLGTNITYRELYDPGFAGWMFNAELSWDAFDAQVSKDIQSFESQKDEEKEGVPPFYFSL